MVHLGIPVLSILYKLKYWYPRVNQQRGTVVFPQTLQIQSDHLKRYCMRKSGSHVNLYVRERSFFYREGGPSVCNRGSPIFYCHVFFFYEKDPKTYHGGIPPKWAPNHLGRSHFPQFPHSEPSYWILHALPVNRLNVMKHWLQWYMECSINIY